MSIISGGVANYNQKFIDTAEHYDEFIMERANANPNIWRDRIPRGAFTLFEGLTKKSNIWRGGLGAQAGLNDWSEIKTSEVGPPIVDACNYTPNTFDYAWETIQYSGYKSSWQSMPICLNDIKFKVQAKEQCRLQSAQCSFITLSVWENWTREMYVKMAVDAGHAVILTDGGMDYIDDTTVRFAYDPFAVDGDGDTYITFDANLRLSSLNMSYFDYLHSYLADQCPEAALSNKGGMPIFGLMLDLRDFEKVLVDDPALREDFRNAYPEKLIDEYPVAMKQFRGWAMIHDSRQMRFKFHHLDAGNAVCKRIKPQRLGRAVTIGNVPEANPEYYKAEVALGVILMNNVLINQVPPTVANMGGQMTFGATPGYNGTFVWINEYDRELNPLKDTGFFFARFEIFPKPLMYSTEAVVFIYRRCPQTWSSGCAVESSTDAVAGPVAITADAVAADVDDVNNRVTLNLAKKLAAQLGDTVTITRVTGGDLTATIVSDAMAPEYTFASAAAVGAETDFTIVATTVTVA